MYGQPPSSLYEALAARFRPIFARIGEGAVERERTRQLPFEAIALLRQAGFGAVRVPESHGGAGATLPELLALLSELAQADSNFPQALRAHFGFVEDTVGSPEGARRDLWLKTLAEGAIFGGAWSETGPTPVGTFSTRVHRAGDHWVLTGRKYYTTGSLYADWIDVVGTNDHGEEVAVIVSTRDPGVQVIDDWDGFGQILTASGTTVFDAAKVVSEPVPTASRFPYAPAFYQAVHLATLTGIARRAASEVARAVRERTRIYSHAAARSSREDPQILQIVGRVHSLAYAAGAITNQAASAVQKAFNARISHLTEGEAAAVNVAAEIDLAQAQSVVTGLVLEGTTILFDALGASATSRAQCLDRHWRKARTISSHNPRVYKDRIVGDFAVNGTEPSFQWKIGQVLASDETAKPDAKKHHRKSRQPV